MDGYIWSPSPEQIERANVTRLMRKVGFEVDARDVHSTARAARAFIDKTCADIEWFWEHALADMEMPWYQRYARLLDTARGPAWADWFIGGETNIAGACVERHAHGAHASKTALIAEAEDGQVHHYTYAALAAEVARLANAMRALGVQRGDRVACYLPMVAEVVFAMLATQK